MPLIASGAGAAGSRRNALISSAGFGFPHLAIIAGSIVFVTGFSGNVLAGAIAAEGNAQGLKSFPRLVPHIGHADAVLCAAFTPVDGLALTGGRNRTLKIWDIATGWLIRTLENHRQESTRIGFSCVELA
jgi:WD40 repeat protein